jgi:hypothetical protein
VENRAVYEIMWKNIVELEVPQMTVWHKRIVRLQIHSQNMWCLLLFSVFLFSADEFWNMRRAVSLSEAIAAHIVDISGMIPCRIMSLLWRFGRTCCLQLYGDWIRFRWMLYLILPPCGWRQYLRLKRSNKHRTFKSSVNVTQHQLVFSYRCFEEF